MPQVKVISPPKPVIDTAQYYDESGTLQTGTTINFDAKNGIRLVLTVIPDYSDRVNQWQTFEFQYSTDSGTTWNTIPTGAGNPTTLDAVDEGDLSAIETTYATDLTIDFYAIVHFYDTATDVRIKITDITGYVQYRDVVTYTVNRPDLSYLTLQSEETYNRLISNTIDWDAVITLQNEETFDRLIYK